MLLETTSTYTHVCRTQRLCPSGESHSRSPRGVRIMQRSMSFFYQPRLMPVDWSAVSRGRCYSRKHPYAQRKRGSVVSLSPPLRLLGPVIRSPGFADGLRAGFRPQKKHTHTHTSKHARSRTRVEEMRRACCVFAFVVFSSFFFHHVGSTAERLPPLRLVPLSKQAAAAAAAAAAAGISDIG